MGIRKHLLLRSLGLGSVTSGSPPIFDGSSIIRLTSWVDYMWIRNQWRALDALTALLAVVHWGILRLSWRFRAHGVQDAGRDHLGEFVMLNLNWTALEELWDLLGRIMARSDLGRVVDGLRLDSERGMRILEVLSLDGVNAESLILAAEAL